MHKELLSIIYNLCACCTTQTISKGHGSWMQYEDDKILCQYDTYVPNYDVRVKLPDGTQKLVLLQNRDWRQEYHPGKWEEYLLSLKPLADAKRAEWEAERKRQEQAEKDLRSAPAGELADSVFEA